MKMSKYREFIDCIMVSAHHADGKDDFDVRLKPSLLKWKNIQLSKFFDGELPIDAATYAIANIVSALFRLKSTDGVNRGSEGDDETDDDDVIPQSSIRLAHKLMMLTFD